MSRDPGAGRRALTAALLCGSLMGCGGPVTSPRPSPPTSAQAGDWTLANVERPADNIASTPPSAVTHDPNSAGHPGHPAGQAVLDAVAAGPQGLLAGGYVRSAGVPRAALWSSATGRDWTIVRGLPAGDGSLVEGVAASRTAVAVGSSGSRPAAWVSTDGATWQAMLINAGTTTTPEPATRMTSVAVGAVTVAGGWAGGPSDQPAARFWVSRNGESWAQASAAPGAAANARLLAVAAGPHGYVAVGQTGSEGQPTGATAWFSADGSTWSRVADRDLPRDAVLEAVTSIGDGFLAVGSSVARDRAVVWGSADGHAWTAMADDPVFHHFGLKVRMLGVAGSGTGATAVGVSLFGTQFGSATAWQTADGQSWRRVPDAPVFDGGEMAAVVESNGTVVAAGTWGAPDQYVPTVWLGPAPAPKP